MSKTFKTGIIIAVIIGVLALILTIILVLPFAQTEAFIADEYRYGLDFHTELDGIPIISQKTGYTCYAVSLVIIEKYLGIKTSEDELRSELGLTNRSTGMLPNDYLAYARKALEPLNTSISIVNPVSQTEILNIITDSLERNLPAIIFYSAKDDWNKPHYNTHYAVVYGIDMKNETVKISNPYGYLEEISFMDLYDGLDFTSYEDEPISFRMARKMGMVKNNTMFILERQE